MDCEWYHQYFMHLKIEYYLYEIAILHGTASGEVIFQQVKVRFQLLFKILDEKNITTPLLLVLYNTIFQKTTQPIVQRFSDFLHSQI